MKRFILSLLLLFTVFCGFAQPRDTTVQATVEFVVNTDRVVDNDLYIIFTREVRVPIKLPDGGLKQGKYYKYELHITSTGNGTNDPNEASDEKDEIIIESLNPIIVNLSVTGYEVGADEKIII